MLDNPAPAKPERSLVHNVAVILGSQVTTWVLSTALLVLVPRLLGPVGVGQLRVAQSLWAIVSVFTAFGTANFLTVEVARHRAQARPLTSAVIGVRLVLWLAALPAVAVFTVVAGYERTVVVVIAISALTALFTLVGTADRSALFGLEQMSPVARVDVLGEVALAVVVIIVLEAGGGTVAYPVVATAVAVVTAVLFRVALRRHAGPTSEPAVRRGRALMRASASYLFADAMVVVYLQIDTLVISLIATEQEVGWYATADTIFGSLLFVPAVLLTAVFPRMARVHHERPEEMAGHVQQAFTTMLIFGVWIGLSTVVVSPSVTTALFGPSFHGTAAVLAVFGLVTILGYQTILLGQFAVATDRARFVGYLVLAASLLSVPLDLVLVRWTQHRYGNGAIGAALAYIVTEGLQVGVGVAVLAPHVACRKTAGRVVRCTIAGAAMLLAGWPLRHQSFVVSGVVVTVVYFGILALLRTLDDFERSALAGLWARVAARRPGGARSAPPAASPASTESVRSADPRADSLTVPPSDPRRRDREVAPTGWPAPTGWSAPTGWPAPNRGPVAPRSAGPIPRRPGRDDE
jgi:O-antigen/teichoic acid export membrane protein